ncbi:hypothetical protein [Neolewinella sp.]|uniref:hypothetical protein n=1 Tax=Neolewinella sp. TaxID=2993543 RepID=UPI003B5193B3
MEIQDAIDAAATGDSIYIHGSSKKYSNVSIDKRLTLIGPGHHPYGESRLPAEIGFVSFDNWNIGDESAFIGLVINKFDAQLRQSGLRIERCRIRILGLYSDYHEGWVIKNNILNRVSAARLYLDQKPTNIILKNNIIMEGVHGLHDAVITNNTFIEIEEKFYSDDRMLFEGVNGSFIVNNIFYNQPPLGAENSTFNNNLTFLRDSITLPYGSNTGTNNLTDVNPMFNNYPGGDFSYDYDFHLANASAAKNAGTDGSDLGVYGGEGFSERGEPPIPLIRSFELGRVVVPPGSRLRISVFGEAKN